jgi:hypothetical protein
MWGRGRSASQWKRVRCYSQREERDVGMTEITDICFQKKISFGDFCQCIASYGLLRVSEIGVRSCLGIFKCRTV